MSRWERLTELFELARALPPDERNAFLAVQCAGDDALRAELDSLLAADSPARSFFRGLEADLVGPSVGRLFDGAETIPPGTILGTYEIEARIGGGGMGVVYRARDRRLDRTVAIKLVAPELIHDAGVHERLVREARAAAALDDPRIAAIHAIEETADGRLFLVMPYYAGDTLKQRLAHGRLDTDGAVAIATELAAGLACAHRAGIVHRDIKPGNVLITNDGAVKILDFGLAKLTEGTGPTRSGTTLGTAAYMAPEQARGEQADPRSDVWSLGVLLYEMLAGRRPFQGDSEPAVLYAVLERSPEPLRTSAPDLPDGLERLVESMLSKDAALRPADAGKVAGALRLIGAGSAAGGDQPHDGLQRVTARNAAATARPAAIGRGRVHALLGTRRWRVTIAAVFAVSIAGSIMLAAFLRSRTDTATVPAVEAIAVLPFVVRGDAELAYLRDGMVHLLSTKLDGIGDLRAVDPHALLASFGSGSSAPDPALGRAAAEAFYAEAFILGAVLRIGTGIELSASLYGRDGELQATATSMTKEDADLPDAVDELVRALVAHRLTDAGAHLAGLAAMTTRSLPALRAHLDGEHLLRNGRPTAAMTAFQEAVSLDSTFGLAWYRLARAAGWSGPVELNEDAAARAVRFGGALPERARALVYAYRVFRTGDPLEAESMYRRILASYPEDMEALEVLGETLFHNNPFFGRPTAEAREPFEHALAMDPGNRELMLHLMELAAAEGRESVLDSLSALYLHIEPGDELPTALHAYAALRALVLDSNAEHEGALARLAAAGPEAVFDALVRVAPHLRDFDLNDRLAAMLADPAHAPGWRANGHLHRAWFAVAQGRWSDAEVDWRAAESIQPGWTLIQRVLTAALPHSPKSPDELDSLRAAVQAWAPPTALEDGLHAGDLDAVRVYLLGLLAWRAADDAGLARAVRELAAVSGPGPGRPNLNGGGTPGLAAAFATTLEALDVWRADRHADALAALDRAVLRIPFHRRARSPLLEQHLNRFVRAEAMRGQGTSGQQAADEDALRWYASLDDGYFHWGAPFLGPTLLAVADIHERHGRAEQAAAAYERFLELWADADPELHTWLELARERLDHIRTDGAEG